MSDFFHPKTTQKANKPHQCIVCLYAIEHGQIYYRQSGVYDHTWQYNKYHVACWDALAEDRDWEFMPGCGEPPEGAKTMAELRQI